MSPILWLFLTFTDLTTFGMRCRCPWNLIFSVTTIFWQAWFSELDFFSFKIITVVRRSSEVSGAPKVSSDNEYSHYSKLNKSFCNHCGYFQRGNYLQGPKISRILQCSWLLFTGKSEVNKTCCNNQFTLYPLKKILRPSFANVSKYVGTRKDIGWDYWITE